MVFCFRCTPLGGDGVGIAGGRGLGEAKALAALVELGAPLNPESTSALATAIVGKNASLAIKLLKAGLKARLSEWQVKGHLALLENIAQENLNLFRGGILGDDEKSEKMIAKIVAALDHSLEVAKARPVCGDEDLPRVLRPGEWPRKLEAPTQHIKVAMPLTDGRTPPFNPPGGFEQRGFTLVTAGGGWKAGRGGGTGGGPCGGAGPGLGRKGARAGRPQAEHHGVHAPVPGGGVACRTEASGGHGA